jgi:HlyD family secretion protein
MKRFMHFSVSGHRKWPVVISLLALVVAAGVGHDRSQRADAPAKSKPVPAGVMVDAVRPRRATLHRDIVQPGQIEAFERTALYSRIPGFVERYHFDIGDRVRKGQVLAELSVPEVVEDLHQREATVIEDEALIVQAREMLRVAESRVTQSDATLRLAEASRVKAEATKAWWKLEHKRVSRLVVRGASPQAEMEQTDEKSKTADAAVSESVAGVALAEAALVESKAQRDKAAADVHVAEARLRVARADRGRAAAILGYARIEAPYDGVLTRRGVDTGSYVQPPAGNPAGAAPLFEIARIDRVRVFVDVPEADAPLVKDGGPARVLVQALGDREIPGCVARSSWLLDDRTRTLRAEIDLPNADGLLRPGMYATARIPVSRPETLTLPTSSVFLQDDQAWVVRLVGNMAVRTPVRLGLRDRERVEVLRKQGRPVVQGVPAEWEDFTDTDLVARNNPSALVDGQEIAIRSERTSIASLAPGP